MVLIGGTHLLSPSLLWLQIVAACHCGKLSKPVRCSQSQFSCGKLCGKRLACGHRCPHKCHAGDCPACTLSATVTCHCAAETKTLPCSQSDFHCDRICGKALPCGRHRCGKVCHGGACGGCPMEGPRLCPCGKVCAVPATVSSVKLTFTVCNLTHNAAALSPTCVYLLNLHLVCMRLQMRSFLLHMVNCSINSQLHTFYRLVQNVQVQQSISQASRGRSADIALL